MLFKAGFTGLRALAASRLGAQTDFIRSDRQEMGVGWLTLSSIQFNSIESLFA